MNRKVLAVPYAVWILGFIIIPLCFIFGRAFTTAEGAFTLSNIFAIVDPLHRKALVLSLELAFLCTTICIILAYPLALIVRNSKMKSSGVIMLILIMPMWMNSILRILALQMILSNNGILNFVLTSLGLQPLQIINTKGAIVLGMVYDFLPYMILPIMNSILAIPQDYVEAAKSYGTSNARIIFRYVLPNAMGPIIVNTTMSISDMMLSAAGLSFIGMGIQPPSPEWGALLSNAQTYLFSAPHMLLFPGLCILFSSLAFNLVGDGLTDALDPKLKD